MVNRKRMRSQATRDVNTFLAWAIIYRVFLEKLMVKVKSSRHEDVYKSGGVAPPLLTSALDGGEWSASRPGRFTRKKRVPGTHWIGGLVNPRAGLDAVEERKILPLPGFDHRPSSPSLYRLSYPDSS
jgi:hypothetical protein